VDISILTIKRIFVVIRIRSYNFSSSHTDWELRVSRQARQDDISGDRIWEANIVADGCLVV